MPDDIKMALEIVCFFFAAGLAVMIIVELYEDWKRDKDEGGR